MKLAVLISLLSPLLYATFAIASDASTDKPQVPDMWRDIRCVERPLAHRTCVICSDSRSYAPAIWCDPAAAKPAPRGGKK